MQAHLPSTKNIGGGTEHDKLKGEGNCVHAAEENMETTLYSNAGPKVEKSIEK